MHGRLGWLSRIEPQDLRSASRIRQFLAADAAKSLAVNSRLISSGKRTAIDRVSLAKILNTEHPIPDAEKGQLSQLE